MAQIQNNQCTTVAIGWTRSNSKPKCCINSAITG